VVGDDRYTPDHLPLLGPLVRRDGIEVDGVTIASVWPRDDVGAAVSRIATDLALIGRTDVVGDRRTSAWTSTSTATRPTSTRSPFRSR
jgi:hypothetical protein